jgi:raffinose/stachyose/melibiose transport system permease protein
MESSDRLSVTMAGRGRLRVDPGVLFLIPALLAVGVFTLYPLLEAVRLAFYHWDGYGAQTFVGLENIRFLSGDQVARTAFGHSLVWLVAAAVLPTAAGLAIAMLVANARAASLWLALIFFPALLPPTVVATTWLLLFSPFAGPINPLLGDAGLQRLAIAPLGDAHQALPALFLAWAWSALGVGVLLFWSALRGVGREFYQIALVEGASAWWSFTHVTLPALRRTAAVVALVNVVLAGQVFDLVYISTGGGPGYATLILPLDMYARAFGGKTGQGAAVALAQLALVAVIAGLIFILTRRHEAFSRGELLDARRSNVLGSIPALAAVLLSMFPLVWLLRAGFLPGRALLLANQSPSLSAISDNLRAAWNLGMSSAVPRSLVLAAAVVAGTLALSVPAGYSLAFLIRKSSVRAGSLALMIVCLIQPAPVLIVPLFSLLRALRLLDNPLGIVLPEVALAVPLATLAVWAGISGLAREPLLAARADGASAWQTLWLIALPLAAPAVAVAAAWAFLTSWNQYLLPTVVSQDGSLSTVPTVLGSFSGAYDTQFGLLAAGAVLGVVPILLLYLALTTSTRWASIAWRLRLK